MDMTEAQALVALVERRQGHSPRQDDRVFYPLLRLDELPERARHAERLRRMRQRMLAWGEARATEWDHNSLFDDISDEDDSE